MTVTNLKAGGVRVVKVDSLRTIRKVQRKTQFKLNWVENPLEGWLHAFRFSEVS